MPDDLLFADLIRRVRARDPQACVELVRLYEPEIRRFVRVKMRDSSLRSFLDSVDICQSVLGNFFVRVVAGQFDIDEPHKLLRLLVRMARNKLRDHLRKPATRKVRQLDEALWDGFRAHHEDPVEALSFEELRSEAFGRLSAEERQLVGKRVEGKQWKEIAAELGGVADALRKQFSRALDRVCTELGFDAMDHG